LSAIFLNLHALLTILPYFTLNFHVYTSPHFFVCMLIAFRDNPNSPVN
jgi:hypothetical protein